MQENVNTIVDWLTQSSADGPRLLDARVRLNDIGFCKQIFKAIREVGVIFQNISLNVAFNFGEEF